MPVLAKSLEELGLTAQSGQADSIRGLAVDSREVRPGYLFAGLAGTKKHGAEFIGFALSQGAVAILTDAAGAAMAADAIAAYKPALIVAQQW